MLLITLIPASPPQEYCSCSVGVTYEFIKRSAFPRVKSSINLRADIFCASYESDVLQNKRLKNDHTLGAPLPTSYAVELRHKI